MMLHWPLKNISEACKNKKNIVFVGGTSSVRISRIAKWLNKSSDYYTILLCHQKGFMEEFSNQYWGKIIFFRNKYHLIRIVKQLKNVYLMHGFATKSYYPDIARKCNAAKFIMDFQDVYACYYELPPKLRWLKIELPYEKNCLEKSDGIIAHSLEPLVAYNKYNIRPHPDNIFFPLYCDDDCIVDKVNNPDPENISFVYAGQISGSHRGRVFRGSTQFHTLIDTLSNQKIHFHIYPSPAVHSTDIDEYQQISVNNPYLHIHPSVVAEEISLELSKYNFGIIPFFLKDTGQSKDKYKYATSLKLFNYIEAGIPVFVSEDVFYQSWLLKRYNAGIIIKEEDLKCLDKLIMSLNYEETVKALKKSRQNLLLSKQISRLTDFYSKIAKK
ncbi:MAG: hypothetical protein PHR81_12595 [Bacteroidales bacterium]|nr:hypothetical protein [Bacteroidales bacterium]MDD4215641.1 hypothetical protein [Bacteroidales bacterium]